MQLGDSSMPSRSRSTDFWLLLLFLVFPGCLAQQVRRDGSGLRQALLDMYTDQAIDNLIRAYENRLFGQFAYTNLSVLDQNKSKGSLLSAENDVTHTNTNDLTKTGLQQLTRAGTSAWKLPFLASNERDRTLSFEANPITTQNGVYEDYLAFARNPALFRVSDAKPTCPMHISRKCGEKWYWVPVEAGSAFLQLVVSTSFVDEQPKTLSWPTTIDSIQQGEGEATYKVTLTKEVPNDDGLLIVTLGNGRRLAIRTQPLLEQELPGKGRIVGPPRGAPTKMLLAQFNPGMPLPAFKNAVALFVSDNYPNTATPTGGDLQKVQDTLDNIRLLINRSATL